MEVPGLVKKTVDAAKGVACGLYKAQPYALIPNPGEGALRYFWDAFCGSPAYPDSPPLPGVPSPPAPPFVGGQCACVVYVVNYTSYFGYGGSNDYIVENRSTRVQGKIGGVFSTQNAPNNWELGFICQGSSVEACKTFPYQVKIHNSDKTKDGKIPYLVINSVSRLDGQPDNCGDLPAAYPPSPPLPPTGYTSPPVAITYNDGSSTNYTFNFKPPTVPIATGELPSLTVNVINPTLSFPINFYVDGDIEVGTPKLAPSPVPPTLGTDVKAIKEDTAKLNYLYDFTFNPPDFDTSPDVTVTSKPVSDGEEVNAPDILGVQITITKFPEKVQYGEPDCYFAGWLTFKTQDGYCPREQINFAVSYFAAPPGAQGYGFTATNGAEVSAKVYTKKKK